MDQFAFLTTARRHDGAIFTALEEPGAGSQQQTAFLLFCVMAIEAVALQDGHGLR